MPAEQEDLPAARPGRSSRTCICVRDLLGGKPLLTTRGASATMAASTTKPSTRYIRHGGAAAGDGRLNKRLWDSIDHGVRFLTKDRNDTRPLPAVKRVAQADFADATDGATLITILSRRVRETHQGPICTPH